MTYENFIQLLRNPGSIEESHQSALRELTEKYPYFGVSRWMYLKSLHASNSVYYSSELRKTALYAANRRNLFFFIHPEEIGKGAANAKDRASMSGSYFDMIDIIENKDENMRGSLQTLAERLKAARELMQSKPENRVDSKASAATENDGVKKQPNEVFEIENNFKEYEVQAKTFIKEKKYKEAIEILEKLNLINPKKSIYFADQIRFLKKIIKT